MTKKIYTIRISQNLPDNLSIWYRRNVGETYRATLAVRENSVGNQVPVFVLSDPPFFHVYPNHCEIVGEKLVG